MAKIIELREDYLKFDNGDYIHTDHCAQCCEHNYADFEQLDDIARRTNFDTKNIEIEFLPNQGFRFGNQPFNMFFVPCYSRQNGYYSSQIDIYVNGKFIGEVNCEEDFI